MQVDAGPFRSGDARSHPLLFDWTCLIRHEVRTAAQQGWDALKNGELLLAAEAAGFEVLLTTDKNMRYQQNLSGRKIAVVVLGRQQWPGLRPYVQLVVEAVNAAVPGSYLEVNMPGPGPG